MISEARSAGSSTHFATLRSLTVIRFGGKSGPNCEAVRTMSEARSAESNGTRGRI